MANAAPSFASSIRVLQVSSFDDFKAQGWEVYHETNSMEEFCLVDLSKRLLLTRKHCTTLKELRSIIYKYYSDNLAFSYHYFYV